MLVRRGFTALSVTLLSLFLGYPAILKEICTHQHWRPLELWEAFTETWAIKAKQRAKHTILCEQTSDGSCQNTRGPYAQKTIAASQSWRKQTDRSSQNFILNLCPKKTPPKHHRSLHDIRGTKGILRDIASPVHSSTSVAVRVLDLSTSLGVCQENRSLHSLQ